MLILNEMLPGVKIRNKLSATAFWKFHAVNTNKPDALHLTPAMFTLTQLNIETKIMTINKAHGEGEVVNS